MAVIRIKRRASGAPGAPASLKNAELAFNEVDSVLYYGFGNDGGDNATSIVAIGGSGRYVDRTTDQTIEGIKTFNGTVEAITQVNTDSSTKVATTAFVKNQNYLVGNQEITVSGDATGSGSTAITLTLADVVTAGTSPKVTFNSKGLITGSSALLDTDIPTLTTTKISDLSTYLAALTLDYFTAPAADLNINGFKLTGLADPINPQDAATKAYVDANAQGLDVKQSVRAVSVSDVALSGIQNIDGVSLVAGDRVLLAGQTDATQNGIYVVASGAWSRAADADNNPGSEVTAGLFTFATEGTAYGDTGWVLTTNDTITLGTTSLSFTQFSGTGQIVAGAGLTKDGASIDVVGTADRIVANADSIDIASTYAGQTSITTLGTVTTGTWNGTAVSLTYGGTGADLSGAADGTIFKKQGTALVAATEGVDFVSGSSTLDGGGF